MPRRSIKQIEEDYFVEEPLKMEDSEVISGLLEINIQMFGPVSENNGKKIKEHLEKIKKNKKNQ